MGKENYTIKFAYKLIQLNTTAQITDWFPLPLFIRVSIRTLYTRPSLHDEYLLCYPFNLRVLPSVLYGHRR